MLTTRNACLEVEGDMVLGLRIERGVAVLADGSGLESRWRVKAEEFLITWGHADVFLTRQMMGWKVERSTEPLWVK